MPHADRRTEGAHIARHVYRYRIKLKGSEKRELRQAKRQGHKDPRLVLRILIILWAAKGKTIVQTAELLECCEQTVLNWRKRFLERRSAGPVKALMDLPRCGRPLSYGPQERAQIIALVCETLHKHELPLSRFSITDLRKVIVREESLSGLSHASLGRTFGRSRCAEAVALSVLALPP